MSESVVLKVSFKKEMRRVPISPPTTWEAVEDSLRSVFVTVPDRFGLTYIDDENDLITVSTDPELFEAFRLMQSTKVSSYKFNLVELKSDKIEQTDEEKQQKLAERLEKLKEKTQRKEERARAQELKKAERLRQKEENKLLKRKEQEGKLKEKENAVGKEKKTVSFDPVLLDIKSKRPDLKEVQPQPPKVIPEIPIFSQWKASVPEPEQDDEFVEEQIDEPIDISGETELDLEEFIQLSQKKKTPEVSILSEPQAEKPVVPQSTPAKKEPTFLEIQLNQLADMGFVDRERNVELLLMNNMEMTEVVKILLGM